MKKDYYEILGLKKGASKDEIKKAYRQMAIRHHPDRNQGNEESVHIFKQVSEAYEILIDDNKKAQYDRFGHSAFESGGFSGFSGFSNFSDIFGEFDDIFSSFFGSGSASGKNRRHSAGEDLVYNIEISLENAYAGYKNKISIIREDLCETCMGKRAEKGTRYTTCNMCNGSGRVIQGGGFLSITTTCPKCHGDGKIIEHPCKLCKGKGALKKQETIDLTIPAGIDDGQQIKMTGKGNVNPNSGTYGDLYVRISIRAHKIFKRNGRDLYAVLPLSFTQAILGKTVKIGTIDNNNIEVKIPKGVQNDEKIVIKNAGMPILQTEKFGNLILVVKIETPKHLSREAMILLESLSKEIKDSEHIDLNRI